MIYPHDGFKLAYTKIRTRRIRLGITLFISSLLFVGVAGILFTVRGVVGSLDNYSKEGLGSRYIVAAYPNTKTDYYANKEVIARAKQVEKEIIAKKTAEAKRLGVDYDAKSDIPATTQYDGPSGKIETLNPTAEAAKQAIGEYLKSSPEPGLDELKKQSDSYAPTELFKQTHMPYGDSPVYIKPLEDGKEKLDTAQEYGPPSELKNFSSNWQTIGKSVLTPFILSGQNLAVGSDGSYPILAPYTALEAMLSVKALPSTAGAKEKLAHLEELREKAKGFKFTACYRNRTSQERISTAVSQQEEIVRNKNDKNYQRPELIYDVPTEPCADVRVTRDVRSAEDKTLANKQLQFRQAFGEPAPVAKLMTFRVVGIVPDATGGSSSTVQQIVQSILSSSVGNGWFSPDSITEDPIIGGLFKPQPGMFSGEQYFAEFPTADSARKFTKEQSCDPDYGSMETMQVGTDFDPFKACNAADKYFSLSAYGSNSLALDEFNKGFNKYFRIAIVAVMVIASLIMMGVVSRVISDSRRETAVFRAIGAKRLDIAQIYLTYVLILCAFIALISTAGGMGIGSYLNSRYATDMKIAATIAFNASSNDIGFSLYKVLFGDLMMLWGVIIAVGVISSSLPLLANLRRNPIRDMRDER